MTTITKQFTQYLHTNNITWGDLEPFQQVRAWVAFLVEWKQAGI